MKLQTIKNWLKKRGLDPTGDRATCAKRLQEAMKIDQAGQAAHIIISKKYLCETCHFSAENISDIIDHHEKEHMKNQAKDVMNDNPEHLMEEYLDEDEKKITKEMIETVANMGFDRDVAQAALRKFKGDVGKTIDLLTKNPDKILDLMMKEEENDKKVEEARKRMEEDLADEEDHLDLTLEEEGAYLEQYQKLLKLI